MYTMRKKAKVNPWSCPLLFATAITMLRRRHHLSMLLPAAGPLGLLSLAALVFYLERWTKGGEGLHQGHLRRQSMQFEQFPTTPVPWSCDVLTRSHDSTPSSALFLESMACGWDASHFTFIARHGYKPNGLVYEATFTDPGPLGLQLNISRNAHVWVDAFLISGGRLLQGQAGRRVHIGDHLLAINGHKLRKKDMTEDGLLSAFQRYGRRPTTLTMLSDPLNQLTSKEAAFSPLFPLLFLRPLAALPPPLHHVCCLVLSILLSTVGIILARGTRSSIFPTHGSLPPLSEILLLSLPSSFVFCLPYSEPLYFLLSSALLFFLANGRLHESLLLSLLLPLCRPLGIFTSIPLLIYAFHRKSTTTSGRGLHHRPSIVLVLLPLGPLLGFSAHLLHQAILHHDPWASLSSQSSFIATFSISKLLWPTHLLPELLFGRQGGPPTWHGDPLNSMVDRLFFLIAILLLALTFRRLPRYVWSYGAVHLLIPPLSGSFMSYTRFFLIGAFPLLWAMEVEGQGDEEESATGGDGVIVINQGASTEIARGGADLRSKKKGREKDTFEPMVISHVTAIVLVGAGMALQADFMRRFIESRWAF